MLENKSLKMKMVGAFAVIAFFLLTVGAFSIYYMKDMSDKYHHVASSNFGNTVTLSIMKSKAEDIAKKTYQIGLSKNPEFLKEIETEMAESFRLYDENDKKYLEIPFEPGEQAIYDAQHATWKDFHEGVNKMIALRKTAGVELSTYANVALTDFRPIVKKYNKGLDSLLEFQETESTKWITGAEKAKTIGTLVSSIIVALGFILSFVIGLLFASTLSNRLRDLANKLNDGATTVSTASQQVSSAGTELSASATEQAAALQQTVASIEEISAMVAKNADNAKRSRDISGSSQDAANRGKQVIGEMIQSIDDISRSNSDIMGQVESSNQQFSEIVKVISDIGEKTKVINDIVFQTKLLSFNASVEAARAGEHGKGFAVVAEEVGNLAQMSGNAAKEISSMLENSIQKVQNTVNQTKSRVETLIQTGKEKVENGSVIAKKCGDVLEEIVQNVSKVGEMVAQIANASAEQAQGVSEINKAMAQMDQVTQQNASASEQSASAAEELSTQASTLQTIVRSLVTTIEGGGASARTESAPTTVERHSRKSAEVIEFKKPKKRAVPDQPLKAVVGHSVPAKTVGANNMPAADDPRFESV